MEENRLVLKLCSLLLDYPDEQWFQNDEIKNTMEWIENPVLKQKLASFYRYLGSKDYEELCEYYVRQFDFSNQTTLYLTYGIFGENRERGQAFVQLKMEFAKAGFYVKDDELPDYLPLILEFSSIAETHFIKKVFLIHRRSIDRLHENLKEQNSPYIYLLEACLEAFENIIGLPFDQINKDNVG